MMELIQGPCCSLALPRVPFLSEGVSHPVRDDEDTIQDGWAWLGTEGQKQVRTWETRVRACERRQDPPVCFPSNGE